MSILLGLTGGIGMGKSTTAGMFADLGLAVWDADAAVHRLYDVGGAAVDPMAEAFPGAIVDGAVSRAELKRIIAQDPAALDRIEAIVHPLLAQDRQAFIDSAQADILLFDIPLLFETGADAWLDKVATVSVLLEEQRRRVLARPGMTEAQFDAIRRRQLDDAGRRARADFIIDTGSLDSARSAVRRIVDQLRSAAQDA